MAKNLINSMTKINKKACSLKRIKKPKILRKNECKTFKSIKKNQLNKSIASSREQTTLGVRSQKKDHQLNLNQKIEDNSQSSFTEDVAIQNQDLQGDIQLFLSVKEQYFSERDKTIQGQTLEDQKQSRYLEGHLQYLIKLQTCFTLSSKFYKEKGVNKKHLVSYFGLLQKAIFDESSGKKAKAHDQRNHQAFLKKKYDDIQSDVTIQAIQFLEKKVEEKDPEAKYIALKNDYKELLDKKSSLIDLMQSFSLTDIAPQYKENDFYDEAGKWFN